MPSFPIKDLHGGITDRPDAPPHYARRLRNYLLDMDGKPIQRNGTSLFGAQGQISTSERVQGIFITPDLRYSDPSKLAMLVYSHRKLWYSGSFAPQTPTYPAGLTELTDVTGAVSIAQNVSIGTKAKFQAANNHIYTSFFNYDAYGALTYHPRPRKIWGEISTANWRMSNVGLPKGPSLTYTRGAAGANSYLYYAVYEAQYRTGSLLYTVQGPPSDVFTLTAAAAPNANAVSITGITWPANGASDYACYPLDDASPSTEVILRVRIYRSKANETTARRAVSVVYNTASTTDSTSDATLNAREVLYTEDGTIPYEEPPPCKLMHVVGDTSYFGGFNIDAPNLYANLALPINCIGQSSPGVPDSCPSTFIIGTPDVPTEINSVDNWPLVFCNGSLWRVEGKIDAYGGGNPVLRTVSERVGTPHPSLVCKTDRGLVFAASDGSGLYFTDGFSVKHLTPHMPEYFKSLWTRDLLIQGGASSAYHAKTKRVFWSVKLPEGYQSNNVNGIVVTDMRHVTDEGGLAHTDLCAENGLGANPNGFSPYALATYTDKSKDVLLIGNGEGYIAEMKIDPTTAADLVETDLGCDGTTASANWKPVPIVTDFISAVLDFGDRFSQKWVTWLNVDFKLNAPASKIYGTPTVYRDGQFRDDTNASGSALALIRETSVGLARRFYRVSRRMAKSALRVYEQQIRLKKASINLYASIPGGTRAYPVATLNRAAKTLRVIGSTWPTDVTVQTIYLGPGYATGFQITLVSGDTITVTDPGNVLPADAGTYEWEIRGVPKDGGAGVGIEAMSIDYQLLGDGKSDHYQTTDAKSNT